MKHPALWRYAWVVLLLASEAVLAQPAAFAERYSAVSPSADGIGKRYMGREISAVMGWQGAAWLERTERDREKRTDLLLAALQLQPGMVVADIGAGTGCLSRRMAPAVTPGGRIVFVEYKAEDPRVPIKPLHKMSEAQIKREAAVFALDWERTVSTLPWQHVVVFRKRD